MDYQTEGKARLYFPLVSKESYFGKQLQGLIKNFFNDSPVQFASFFAKQSSFTEAQLKELKSMIDDQLNQKKVMEYLLKSILCLLLLLLFYRLFLQQEVLYRFNRFYLLFAVLISFLLPLNQIEIEDSFTIEQLASENLSSTSIGDPKEVPQNVVPVNPAETSIQYSWKHLGIGLYGLVSLIFAYRFFWNFSVLKNKASSNIRVVYRDQVLVLLEEYTLPYSFLDFIFVHKKSFQTEGLSDAVFEHERCHVREKHSLDLIFIEFLMIPFWFHPGLYWAKQSIQLNHEFIADRAAIQKVDQMSYQRQLLSLAISSTQHPLTSHLNFSLTKKRMQMMSKEQKPIRTALKLLFLIPMMGLIYYGFSEKVTVQNEEIEHTPYEDDKAYTLVYQSPPQKMTKTEYYSQTKFILKYPDGDLEEKKL